MWPNSTQWRWYAAGFAPQARSIAQPILSAEGAHEGCEATEKPTEQEARAFARTAEKTNA